MPEQLAINQGNVLEDTDIRMVTLRPASDRLPAHGSVKEAEYCGVGMDYFETMVVVSSVVLAAVGYLVSTIEQEHEPMAQSMNSDRSVRASF